MNKRDLITGFGGFTVGVLLSSVVYLILIRAVAIEVRRSEKRRRALNRVRGI